MILTSQTVLIFMFLLLLVFSVFFFQQQYTILAFVETYEYSILYFLYVFNFIQFENLQDFTFQINSQALLDSDSIFLTTKTLFNIYSWTKHI